jgi:C4-dicarboxylate-specific signal transduction histidine kinase
MSRPPPERQSSTDAGKSTRRRPTVAHWLILLLVAFLVGPMYASNLWGYLQSRRYLTDAAFLNIRNVAALEASETREFVRAAENLVSSIVAGNHYLFQVIRLMEDTEGGDERRGLSEALGDHLEAKADEGAGSREFSVISIGGRLLAASGEGWVVDSDMSESRCYQSGSYGLTIAGFEYPEEEAGANGHHHEHDDQHSGSGAEETDHAPRLIVSGPIKESDGRLLGIFCARFTFDVHRGLLVAHKNRTRHAMLYLLNEEGKIVCGSFDEIRGAPYGETLDWIETRNALGTEAWEGRYRAKDGTETMAAYAPVPVLGWGVVVEVPVIRALADLERLKWEAMIGSGLLAAMLGIAAFLSWRTFVRPLQALSNTSARMASGDPGETVTPGGLREIADLASVFNRMSLALRDSQESLEVRIAERTRELQESREFLELLLDSIDQRVVVVDREYKIIKANAAAVRMHGHGLVGERCFRVFEALGEPPEDYPARHTFETGQVASAERSQKTVRGREAVYVETYPVFDAEGGVESVVEIGRVVTAEKQLQMQMVYQGKMATFGQLAAGIAHEIGNPIAAIESQLRMAEDDPIRASQTLAVVRKQVGRMDRMLRRLVNFTRRKRDEVMLTSANQVVDDVAQLLEHDPRARTISIDCKLPENLPGIRAKEDDLVQVLLNLGLNALDAIGENGTVEFETSAADGKVTIRVRDTGTGIVESARASLFDPFFTTKGQGRGTGLGLFVSKGIIDSIGGDLGLERTGPGGTTFLVRLPVGGIGMDGGGI